MKKTIKVIAFLLVAIVLVACVLSGCDIKRKLTGAEMNFPTKISNAKALSFQMNINYKKGDTTTVIDMDCYKTTNEYEEEEYAYIYTCQKGNYSSYKNIYADDKLYEIANLPVGGIYYVKDDVSVSDDSNILYQVTQNIMLTSVAALLVKAKKETLNGEQVYRYDVEISGKNVSIWYNSEVLVQLYAKFAGENGEPDEEYTIALSNYKIDEEISADVFARPDTYTGYVESQISFEAWMEIINAFAKRLGN